MEAITAVYDLTTGFGPRVMMPIIITVLDLILWAKFGNALGVGFVGINLVVSLIFQRLVPLPFGIGDRSSLGRSTQPW